MKFKASGLSLSIAKCASSTIMTISLLFWKRLFFTSALTVEEFILRIKVLIKFRINWL